MPTLLPSALQPSLSALLGTLAPAGLRTSKVQRMRWLLTTVHVLALLLAVSIPLYFLSWNVLFTWHPTLMALAFLGFMTEGVLTAVLFRAKDGQERVAAIQKHLVWQLLGFACLIGGFAAIYQNKVLHGKPHYTSVHSRFGLATLILGCLAPAGGLISFRKLGLLQRFPEQAQARLKWAHRNAGMVTWLLALVTILLGLAQASVWKGVLSWLWQAGVLLLGVALLLLAALQMQPRLPTSTRPDFELTMEPGARKHITTE